MLAYIAGIGMVVADAELPTNPQRSLNAGTAEGRAAVRVRITMPLRNRSRQRRFAMRRQFVAP